LRRIVQSLTATSQVDTSSSDIWLKLACRDLAHALGPRIKYEELKAAAPSANVRAAYDSIHPSDLSDTAFQNVAKLNDPDLTPEQYARIKLYGTALKQSEQSFTNRAADDIFKALVAQIDERLKTLGVVDSELVHKLQRQKEDYQKRIKVLYVREGDDSRGMYDVRRQSNVLISAASAAEVRSGQGQFINGNAEDIAASIEKHFLSIEQFQQIVSPFDPVEEMRLPEYRKLSAAQRKTVLPQVLRPPQVAQAIAIEKRVVINGKKMMLPNLNPDMSAEMVQYDENRVRGLNKLVEAIRLADENATPFKMGKATSQTTSQAINALLYGRLVKHRG
jgi:hypothetical protein